MQGEYLKPVPQEILEFIKLPKGPRKNVLGEKLTKDHTVAGVLREGDDISYYYHMLKLTNVGGTFFLKPIRKSGLSYKNGKLSLWFGSTMAQMGYSQGFLTPLFNYMGWDFITKDSCNGMIWEYITKGILERLFKGKITTTRQLLAAYAKLNRIDVSTELLYQEINRSGMSKRDFLYHASLAKDVNHYLEWRANNINTQSYDSFHDRQTIIDLLHQFKLLGKKIDFKWSTKRIDEEHKKAVKELMEYQLEEMSDQEIQYPDLPYPPEFELLNTEKKIFYEGKTMNHCLYTNYATSIKNKNYLAFHVTLGGEEATLGLHITNNEVHGPMPTFNQVYSKYNKRVSDRMRDFCYDWVKSVNPKGVVLF
jgi:hypothetical protein